MVAHHGWSVNEIENIMKKTACIIMTLALAAGGILAARAGWRAHHQIVTLNVRNMPLAQVIRKLEWQTWQKICVDGKLSGNVTLAVRDRPLTEVLERVAEQTDAHWCTVHAVYDTSRALRQLKNSLTGGNKWEEAGWTNLIPAGLTDGFAALGQPAPTMATSSEPRIVIKLPAGGNAADQKATDDQIVAEQIKSLTSRGLPTNGVAEQIKNALKEARANPGAHKARSSKFAGSSKGFESMTWFSDGTSNSVWLQEQLVLEGSLLAQAQDNLPDSTSAEAAGELARQVHGRCADFYLLQSAAPGEAQEAAVAREHLAWRLSGQPEKPGAGIVHQKYDDWMDQTPAERAARGRPSRKNKAQ